MVEINNIEKRAAQIQKLLRQAAGDQLAVMIADRDLAGFERFPRRLSSIKKRKIWTKKGTISF